MGPRSILNEDDHELYYSSNDIEAVDEEAQIGEAKDTNETPPALKNNGKIMEDEM